MLTVVLLTVPQEKTNEVVRDVESGQAARAAVSTAFVVGSSLVSAGSRAASAAASAHQQRQQQYHQPAPTAQGTPVVQGVRVK